jgi:hypothetical protein
MNLLGKKRYPSTELSIIETPKMKSKIIENNEKECTFRNIKDKINKISLNGSSDSKSSKTDSPNGNTNASSNITSDDSGKIKSPSYETLISEYYSKSNKIPSKKIPIYRGLNSILAGSIKTIPQREHIHKKQRIKQEKGTIHSFFERFRNQERNNENDQENLNIEEKTQMTVKSTQEYSQNLELDFKYKMSIKKDTNTNDTLVIFTKEPKPKEDSDDEILAENTPTKSIFKKNPVSLSKTNLLKLFNQTNKI